METTFTTWGRKPATIVRAPLCEHRPWIDIPNGQRFRFVVRGMRVDENRVHIGHSLSITPELADELVMRHVVEL